MPAPSPANPNTRVTGLASDSDVAATFQKVWQGGYREAVPEDPLTESTFYHFGYVSVMHVLFNTCIRPYITPQTVALEIGCGGGAWTKNMLPAKEVWCLDAKTAADNQIMEYLGHPQHLHYLQVSGADCSGLPDNHFDYLFTFGVLCHLPFETVCEYFRNLFPKLKPGAHAFVMVADYEKSNRMWNQRERYSIIHRLAKSNLGGRRYWPVKALIQAASRMLRVLENTSTPSWAWHDLNEDSAPRPARWYHAGTGNAVRVLRELGYDVVCEDMQIVHRDPIIHFRKPG